MTNADCIRHMSDEQLYEFLSEWECGDIDYSVTFCDLCNEATKRGEIGNVLNLDCDGCRKHWLQRDAVEYGGLMYWKKNTTFDATADRKTEPTISKMEQVDKPQTDNGIGCSRCESRYGCYDRDMPHAVHCNNYGKVTDEPQTSREKTRDSRDSHEIAKDEPTISKMEQVDKDINVRSKDEPQTEDADCDKCIWSVCNYNKAFAFEDEPQTDTEIAKAIVHKMIDDAVIAEDAYPDLRQKMHDAVDEYESQTDCPWK